MKTQRQREKKIMKKLLIVVALLASSLTPAHAEPTQTIAVIDSGVNTALFTNIVTEVCILEYSNCANGEPFMEGKGAANTGVTTNAALNHATGMISIINKVNPSVNIIPIRIIGKNFGKANLNNWLSIKFINDKNSIDCLVTNHTHTMIE
jgi:hypothetical protein